MRRLRLILLSFVLLPALASADDAQSTLAAMLDTFLAGASAGEPAAHERFWADDLIYTSSNGTRTNKAAILESARAAVDAQPETPAVVYTAEDVDIRVYGDAAVVAFRLVATPSGDGDAAVRTYFNTGTFLERGGEWRAVAWQATRIPTSETP